MTGPEPQPASPELEVTGPEPQPVGPELQVRSPEPQPAGPELEVKGPEPQPTGRCDSPTAQSLRAWPPATPGTPCCPGTARHPRLPSEARGEGAAPLRREAQPLPPRSLRPKRPTAAARDRLPGKHRAELTCWRPAADPRQSPQSLNCSSLRPRSAVPQLQGVAEPSRRLPPKPDRAVCVAGPPLPRPCACVFLGAGCMLGVVVRGRRARLHMDLALCNGKGFITVYRNQE